MLALTKKTDYALIALAHLAHAVEEAAEAPISARHIAEQYRLPLPLLMNVLKQLAQANLVHSTRGATGGYSLAVDPEHTTLLQVIEAIEGPVQLMDCCQGLVPTAGKGCEREEDCPIRNSVHRLHGRLLSFFANVRLSDIVQDSPASNCGCGHNLPTHSETVTLNVSRSKTAARL